MDSLSPKPVPATPYFWAGFVGIIFFVAVASRFLYLQSLWVDESTQLSGITLSVVQVYQWLSGLIDNPFLVPADRMPILSYAVGIGWSNLFGADPIAMRWLSLVCVTVGLLFAVFYLKRIRQPALILPFCLFLCLSPNLTVIAVEIRAYALFFLFASIAALLFLQIVEAAQRSEDIYWRAICLAILLALAINTHLFGVLLAGSVLATYLILRVASQQFPLSGRLFLSICGVMLAGLVVVLPPVMGAIALSSSGDASGGDVTESFSIIKLLVKLIYRLVAHQSMAGVTLLSLLALAIVYGTIVISLIKKLTWAKTALVLVLVLGVGVAFLADILLSGFKPLAPSYNIWMLPFLAVLFALCFVDYSKVGQWLIALGLIISMGFGQYNLATAGEKFAHTRFNTLEKLVYEYEPTDKRIAIIYRDVMAKTWFPGLYQLNGVVQQYIVKDDGYVDLVTRDTATVDAIANNSDIIFSVYGRILYSDELAAAPTDYPLPETSPAYQQVSLDEMQWQLREARGYKAQESAEIVVYQRQ